MGSEPRSGSARGRLPTNASRLNVVRVGLGEAPPPHRVVARIDTGVSAEGLAISPDGRMLATSSMGGTAFPPGHPRHEWFASVSLFSIDPETGSLALLDDAPLGGALPKGLPSTLRADTYLQHSSSVHVLANPSKRAPRPPA